MNILISGNPTVGLAKSLHELYPDATYCSRSNGYDLVENQGINAFAELSTQYDVVIVNSALWRFHQTVLCSTQSM